MKSKDSTFSINRVNDPSGRTDTMFLGTYAGGPRRGLDDKEYPTIKER